MERRSLQGWIDALVSGADPNEASLQLRIALEEYRGVYIHDEALGIELKLSPEDVESVITQLCNYLDTSDRPAPQTFLVLAASRDKRVVPHMVGVLERLGPVSNDDPLVSQCVCGLIPFIGEFDDGPVRRLRMADPAGDAASLLNEWFGA